jgi:hypothetical protein
MKLRIALAAFAGVAALAAAGATAAAATGTTGTATTAVTASNTPPRCNVEQLSAGFHGFQLQAGNRGFLLTLTNTGGTSCSLYGYPGLQLANGRQQPLPTKTLWGSTYFDRNPGRSLIVLSPGETASADVSYGINGTAANSVFATYLEVTPPNCYFHFTLRLPPPNQPPAFVYLGRVQVTAMARHTPYLP